MAWFKLRYIWGFQDRLQQECAGYMEAASIHEALASKSRWPVQVRYNRTSAWARNPGTSLYYIEAWEADVCDEPPIQSEHRRGMDAQCQL